MSISAKLKTAQTILSRGAWSQNTFATDKSGLIVDVHDPRAQRWCAVGILWKVTDFSGEEVSECTDLLKRAGGIDVSIPMWNDNSDRKLEQVLQVFGKAIKLAQETEQYV